MPIQKSSRQAPQWPLWWRTQAQLATQLVKSAVENPISDWNGQKQSKTIDSGRVDISPIPIKNAQAPPPTLPGVKKEPNPTAMSAILSSFSFPETMSMAIRFASAIA